MSNHDPQGGEAAAPASLPPPAAADPDGLVQIAVRIPRRLLEALDAEVARCRAQRPAFNRSDFLRELIAGKLHKAAAARR